MMYEFDIAHNIMLTPILFVIFLISSMKVCEFFKISYKVSAFLYIWHMLFCIMYMYMAINFGADSNKYFYEAINFDGRDFNFGTSFIIHLTYFFYNFLHFSYIDQFLLHGFIGFIGLLAFAASIKQVTLHKSFNVKILGWLIVFLPSVSFWTTALGKDAISFMATGLALWAALDFKNRKLLFLFSVLCMFMVRPHIGAILIIAFIFSLIFDKKVNIYSKFFFGTLSFFITLIILPIMMNYIGLSEAENISDVEGYIDKRQSSNLSGGSSLDISSMSLPMQMLTYLFRPMPFEAHTIFALIASLDNVVILFLFILGLYYSFKKSQPAIESNRIFLWVYFFMCLIVLSMTTANLGIAMRQKWMFMPMFVFLMLSIVGSNKKNTGNLSK